MFKRHIIQSKLDDEIIAALEELEKHREDSHEYGEVVDRIAKLDKLKSEGFRPPSLDTVLIVAANVFGILWIARYEREDAEVIKAPNAFKMVMRPR